MQMRLNHHLNLQGNMFISAKVNLAGKFKGTGLC